jgi:hypothetical protein
MITNHLIHATGAYIQPYSHLQQTTVGFKTQGFAGDGRFCIITRGDRHAQPHAPKDADVFVSLQTMTG